MSAKFMKIKRIVIPTITMVMIASQLMGCSAATSSELMTMLENNEAIEIEIAEPINNEQGTESELSWVELALLKENPELRKGWDNALNISAIENGKNGMLYVNEKGEQTNNNTLYVALHNRQFQKALEGDTKALVEASVNAYADLESVSDDDKEVAVLMGINGYFNLLPDSTPNYSNPDSTIERNEFMAMLYRANNPVQELQENNSFNSAVGSNKYNIYAQGSLSSSYLDTSSKSLDNLTYNGTITRAEAVYAVVQMYFADEYKNVDINASTYSDCKNGGNIAQSAVDKTKKVSSLSEVDHWKSYELTYALQNPDTVGMPTDLYKAMVVAKQKGLIDGNTSRWDEGLTKAEAIDLLVRAIKQDDSMESFNVLRAEIKSEEELANEAVKNRYEHEVSTSATSYTTSPMDETMYAITDAYTYDGPSTEEYKIKATVQKDEQVKVVGKVQEVGWYEIEQEGEIRSFISADFLTSTAPVSASTPAQDQAQTPAQTQAQAQVSTPQTSQNTEPQQQTQTPQQVQETPQNSSPSSTEKNLSSSQVINPATGDYYKPGDVMPDGKTIYAGDFNSDDFWSWDGN